MKTAMIGLLGVVLSAFAIQANALSNFGLYEKLYDDGDESVYGLIWEGYDPAVYDEPIRSGDFRVPETTSGCSSDRPGESDEMCGNAVLTEDDDIDTIYVVGKRPQRYVYFFQSPVDTSPGPGSVAVIGRGAGTAYLGQYVRLGNMVISAQQLADLAAKLHQLTYDWAIADINRFRTHGEHVPFAQGSLLPWHNMQVDWNDYGAGNPNLSDEEVYQNMIEALSQP